MVGGNSTHKVKIPSPRFDKYFFLSFFIESAFFLYFHWKTEKNCPPLDFENYILPPTATPSNIFVN